MQLSELCGIITPPTNPFNPIITQQVNPFNPLNPLFTYRKQRCSPTDLTDFWVRRINNGFIGLNGFWAHLQGGALVSARLCRLPEQEVHQPST